MGYTNDTAITPPKIEVGTDDIADMVKQNETDALADAISWFWQHFVSDGTSLYQDLVKPVSGDFNRIKANGQAWVHTGDMLFNMGSNMELNSRKLVGAHWTGDAAEAFRMSVVTHWLPALVGAREVCKLIGKGFEKIADASIKVAKEIVTEIIPKIMRLIRKLAAKIVKKMTPGGVLVSAIGYAWDFVRHGEFPEMDTVRSILALVNQVKALFESIRAVVAVAKNYVNTTLGIINLMKTLPKPGEKDVSLADSKQALDELKAQTKAARESYELYAGKPVTDKDGNQLDKDGNIVIDKDGNVVNPDGEVARERSEHDEAVDRFDREVDKMDKIMNKKQSTVG